jgi:predicted nucleotidyltransferase
MATKQLIDVDANHLEIIKQVLHEFLSGKTVWAYGSRVNFNAGKYSDLDLVVFDATEIDLGNASEIFEESAIPYKVSMMLWDKIPMDFQENIKQKYIVLQGEDAL